MDNREKLATR